MSSMMPKSRGRWVVLILLLAGLAGALWLRSRREPGRALDPAAPGFITNALALLEAHEARAATQYWAGELLAQAHGRVIDGLWNGLNASTSKLERLGEMKLKEIRLPKLGNAERWPHGIELARPLEGSERLDAGGWAARLESWRKEGWQLEQCEFRHNSFWKGTNGLPSISFYQASGHLVNPAKGLRAEADGEIEVQWEDAPGQGGPGIARVDASRLEARWRAGPPAFREVLLEEVAPPAGSYFIDPLIVRDLDGDGVSEFILAAKNRVYRREVDGSWASTNLCASDPGLIFTAIMGDFDGDRVTDFLTAKFDGLFLHKGTAEGKFPDAPRLVWHAQPRLKYGQVLTAGDVDGDRDLDLFLGQYKPPYDKGQMPMPYFDANDGYPSFLLLNDREGNFADGTLRAGLAGKRARRTYSASLVDLDYDGDLDLVVVSDFAGVDAYENQGNGVFRDATAKWFDDPKAFGMAHSFADFNADGLLDFLVIGMNSPVAHRLQAMGLSRPYDAADAGMRERVTFGNRLFAGRADGTFRQGKLGEKIARTGWSWGSAAADFDNDGFADVYIANGHETRASVEDYETEFWLHDIYVGNSQENALAMPYFQRKHARLRGAPSNHSYGGWEKNRLLLNLGGTNFVEVAHLFGVALEADSRNVVAEDLNGDGRLDLMVTTFEVFPKVRQTLRIYQNELPEVGNAAEIVLKDVRRVGAAFRLSGPRPLAGAIVTGDSYRSQSAPKLHIGLGNGRAEDLKLDDPERRIEGVFEIRGLRVKAQRP